ncbi:MAG TPA: c-type cytochrome [Burkholderiales bacterium]
MRSSSAVLLGFAGLVAAAHATADTGEEVVKARCSLCHEGGAGGAPKIGNRTDWEPRAARGKLALYEIALNGKPNTAMMARGGFRDLSRDEVMSAVDYMVAQAGFKPGLYPEAVEVAKADSSTPKAPLAIDDQAITDGVAKALRREVAPPDAKIETYEGVTTVGGVGIKIRTRMGVVTLDGMVKSAEIVERAEAIAKAVDGVKNVDNNLIPATIFESD